MRVVHLAESQERRVAVMVVIGAYLERGRTNPGVSIRARYDYNSDQDRSGAQQMRVGTPTITTHH